MTTPHIGDEDELVTAEHADDETEQPEQAAQAENTAPPDPADEAEPDEVEPDNVPREMEREHRSLKEAKTALNGYFALKRNVVAERYKFKSRCNYLCQNHDQTSKAHPQGFRSMLSVQPQAQS